MPVVPSCLLEPAWVEFSALIGGDCPQFDPGHPLGCHRRRVPGRVVFEHVVAALVHGSGYERIATPGCSDRTIRRRLDEWAEMGVAEALHAAALRAYDQIIGLELGDVAVDGCMTKAPCGGERAGPSPAGRRKGGLKRSVASDGCGIPLGIASAGANRHDSPLLAPTLQAAGRQLDGILPDERTCHLDRGYDSTVTRQLLDELGFDGAIARKGVPAPIQAGPRWVIERTHAWMNGYGKLRRCTERNAKIAGLLPLPRRRPRHYPSAHPASPQALPLGHPPDDQAAEMIPIAGRSKSLGSGCLATREDHAHCRVCMRARGATSSPPLGGRRLLPQCWRGDQPGSASGGATAPATGRLPPPGSLIPRPRSATMSSSCCWRVRGLHAPARPAESGLIGDPCKVSECRSAGESGCR